MWVEGWNDCVGGVGSVWVGEGGSKLRSCERAVGVLSMC